MKQRSHRASANPTPPTPPTPAATDAAEPAASLAETLDRDHTLCPQCGNLTRRIGQSLTAAGLVRYRRCTRCSYTFKTLGVWLRGEGEEGLRASEQRM